MRIVHLIDYFQPILGYQETYLSQMQTSRGHDVTVVTSDRYYPFPNYDQTIRPILGERLCGTGYREECGVRVLRLTGGLEYRRRCVMRHLSDALRDLRPDAIHSHGLAKPHSITAARRKDKLQSTLLIDDHSHIASTHYGIGGRSFHWLFRVLYAQWLQQKTDAFVAITDETASIMRSDYGINHSTIHILPLGVDISRFSPSADDRARMRSRFGFVDEDFVLVYTGKIVASKGPHLLLQAMQQCDRSVKALLVGNIGESYAATFQAALQPVADRVVISPAVAHEELCQFYRCGDAGCWPLEASIGMLEAASCELPIIVHTGGLDERIANDNGLAYREGDAMDLARAITTFVSDRARAREMGRRGRTLVQQVFSWETICDKFEALYAGTR